MKTVHANMPITPYFFDEFNNALVGVLAGAGVTSEDQAAVMAVLQSTKGDICNTDCAATTGTTMSSTTSSATSVVASFAAVAGLVALLF